MGGAVCAKILLCWPPIADGANLVMAAMTDYTTNLQTPYKFTPDELHELVELGERAEAIIDKAKELMVKAQGGY